MDKSIISPKCMHIVSFALVMLLLVMSPLPVLAYSPMVKGTSENSSVDAAINFDGALFMIFDQDAFYTLNIYDPLLESVADYDIFVAESGNTYAISETVSQSERASCVHSWQNGKLSQHIKNDNGSCTVNVYEAQLCSKCGEYKTGNLYTSMLYPKCPH